MSPFIASFAGALLSTLCSEGPLPAPSDVQRFTPGTTVSVFLDWESFKTFSGVSDSLKSAAQVGIDEATWRWSSIPNSNIRLKFGGFRQLTTIPAQDEIVVRMQPVSSVPLRSAEASSTQRIVTFFARFSDGTNIPWLYTFPFNPPGVTPGGLEFDFGDGMDFTAVLNHELGHALGLRAHDDAGRSVVTVTVPHCFLIGIINGSARTHQILPA